MKSIDFQPKKRDFRIKTNKSTKELDSNKKSNKMNDYQYCPMQISKQFREKYQNPAKPGFVEYMQKHPSLSQISETVNEERKIKLLCKIYHHQLQKLKKSNPVNLFEKKKQNKNLRYLNQNDDPNFECELIYEVMNFSKFKHKYKNDKPLDKIFQMDGEND